MPIEQNDTAPDDGTPRLTLAQARNCIDRPVTYHPGHGDDEHGHITSVGDRYVFVRYQGDQHSKATDPAMLSEWVR